LTGRLGDWKTGRPKIIGELVNWGIGKLKKRYTIFIFGVK
jgi:hypothetical protein